MRQLIEALKQKQRKHAAWWSWVDKEGKEINVASDFFRELENRQGLRTTEFELVKNDPPDLIATMIDDSNSHEFRVGIELTELVNQAAIVAQIKNEKEYVNHLLDWGSDKISTRVNERIREKDKKCRSITEGCDRMILVLHTHEPELNTEKVEEALNAFPISPSRVFDNIYILFGYHPKRGYELMEL